MKISFSRKGFDSSAGGVPSPIINGRPTSLPIPTKRRSATSYGDVGLGEVVTRLTRGRITGQNLCHLDPMFENGTCAFGQTGAAQTHLANRGFGVGDVFLFFGLFADENGRDRQHRIFGYLQVAEVVLLGAQPGSGSEKLKEFRYTHPHTIGGWNDNNTLYLGPGRVARTVSSRLRLSRPGGPLSKWRIPAWLKKCGLSYHANPARWAVDGELQSAAKGQEFVADLGDDQIARQWVETIIRDIDHGEDAS
jgi:hypothetical protein